MVLDDLPLLLDRLTLFLRGLRIPRPVTLTFFGSRPREVYPVTAEITLFPSSLIFCFAFSIASVIWGINSPAAAYVGVACSLFVAS